MTLLSLTVFMYTGLGAGCSYLFNIVAVRLIGAANFGHYVIAYALCTLLGALLAFGTNTSCFRYIPTYSFDKQHDSLFGYIRFMYLIALVPALVCAIVGVLFLLIPGLRVSISQWYSIGLIMILFYVLSLQQTAILKSLNRQKVASFIEPIVRFAGQTGILILLALLMHNSGAIFISYFIILFIMILAQRCFIHNELRKKQSNNDLPIAPRYHFKTWISVSAPMLAISGFIILLDRLQILCLSFYLPSAQVSYYYVGYNVSAVLTLAMAAVYTVLSPKVTLAMRNLDDAQKLAKFASIFTFSASIITTMLLLFLAKPILLLFGKSFYHSSFEIMWVLLISQVITSLFGIVDRFLLLNGNQSMLILPYLLTVIITGILDIIFIPTLGILGAALALATAIIFRSIYLYVLTYRVTNIDCFITRIFR